MLYTFTWRLQGNTLIFTQGEKSWRYDYEYQPLKAYEETGKKLDGISLAPEHDSIGGGTGYIRVRDIRQ